MCVCVCITVRRFERVPADTRRTVATVVEGAKGGTTKSAESRGEGGASSLWVVASSREVGAAGERRSQRHVT